MLYVSELWNIILNFILYTDVQNVIYIVSLIAKRDKCEFNSTNIMKYYTLQQLYKNPYIKRMNYVYNHIGMINTPALYIKEYFNTYNIVMICSPHQRGEARLFIEYYLKYKLKNNENKHKINHLILQPRNGYIIEKNVELPVPLKVLRLLC